MERAHSLFKQCTDVWWQDRCGAAWPAREAVRSQLERSVGERAAGDSGRAELHSAAQQLHGVDPRVLGVCLLFILNCVLQLVYSYNYRRLYECPEKIEFFQVFFDSHTYSFLELDWPPVQYCTVNTEVRRVVSNRCSHMWGTAVPRSVYVYLQRKMEIRPTTLTPCAFTLLRCTYTEQLTR